MHHARLATTFAPLLLASFATSQAAWARRYPAQSPAPRVRAAMAFDEFRGGALLLFGSDPQGQLFADSWRWDGSNWQQINVPLPPVRRDHRMVWDARRQRVVLFGGSINNGPDFQDLWEWDGAQWVQRVTAFRPPARGSHGMAYDRDRGVVVIFGGVADPDTWEWDGTAWHAHPTTVHPSLRSNPAMAFDPVNGSILLFGGEDAQGWTMDTWSWDGTSWTQRLPANVPFARPSAILATDLHRRRVVLYGNSQNDPFHWEWDGSSWHLQAIASPGPREGVALAYDTTRREVACFGGFFFLMPGAFNDTWVYRTAAPATITTYGIGCPGSAGVPLLANAPYSFPWIGDSFTTRATNLAPAVGAVIFATGVTSDLLPLDGFGMPGCFGLVRPLATDFRVAIAGAADWMVSIPNSTALAGVHVCQQAFALEPGANAAGIVASYGADLVVGIR